VFKISPRGKILNTDIIKKESKKIKNNKLNLY